MATKKLQLVPQSREWHEMRKRCTRAVPGKHSALYYLNSVVLGGEVVPMTPRAHLALCLFIEGATGIKEIDSCRVKMVLVPRGLGKSTLGTKGRAIQRLLAEDDYSIGIANEKQDLADGFLGQIKTEFETNLLLQTLFPERIPDFKSKDLKWAASRIEIARKKRNATSPSVLATGVGGTVTGVHMNEWILDDIISQNAAEAAHKGNFAEIEGTNRWITRIQPLLKSPKKDPILIIGTRWWQGDTYEFIEDFFGHSEPKQEFTWTLTLPDGETQTIQVYKRGEIAVFKRSAIERGDSIFPERYSLEDLQEMQREDPVFFAGQYLLEPTAGAASEFRPEWIKYYDWDQNQIRFKDSLGKISYTVPRDMVTFMSVDPAIADSNSAARSAVPVVGVCKEGQFLLEDTARKGLGPFDLSHVIVDQFLRYKPRKIFIETLVYQRALMEVIAQVSRERGCPEILGHIEEIRSHGKVDKLTRIYSLEPFFKRGNFYINRTHTNFREEYDSFPRGAKRDLLDSLAFQTNSWERMMSQMDEKGPYDQRTRDRAQLERYLQSIGKGGGY